MAKQIIQTDQAPAAVGPYSQATKANGMVYLSGQIPIDPASGEVVSGGIEAQTHQVLKNLGAVLAAAGSSLEQVLKVTVFITDMGQFATVNQIYSQYFSNDPPARACVEVSALPKAVEVEMEAVALCS